MVRKQKFRLLAILIDKNIMHLVEKLRIQNMG